MDGKLADGGVQRAEEGFPADGGAGAAAVRRQSIPPCIPKSNWRAAPSGITWSATASRFRNFGEGFELAGVDEGKDLEPTGARFLTNIPMPDPLYRNTSRKYPGFNMNMPDQFRATQFIKEMEDGMDAAAVRLHPPAQRPHDDGAAGRRLSVSRELRGGQRLRAGPHRGVSLRQRRNGARRQSS